MAKGFNPSQVGFKQPDFPWTSFADSSFNPSQVGFKLALGENTFFSRCCFNPSQVGFKPSSPQPWSVCFVPRFNPSQVGFKPLTPLKHTFLILSFNPSQVGFKRALYLPPYGLCIVSIPLRQASNLITGFRSFLPKRKFQSLLGRLQTTVYSSHQKRTKSFNPSQVGFKLLSSLRRYMETLSFNPSQVGFKLIAAVALAIGVQRFNPSQVGFKPRSGYKAKN